MNTQDQVKKETKYRHEWLVALSLFVGVMSLTAAVKFFVEYFSENYSACAANGLLSYATWKIATFLVNCFCELNQGK